LKLCNLGSSQNGDKLNTGWTVGILSLFLYSSFDLCMMIDDGAVISNFAINRLKIGLLKVFDTFVYVYGQINRVA
jgi:hypothetical protein